MQIWIADSNANGEYWVRLSFSVSAPAAFFQFGPDGYSLFQHTDAILGLFRAKS
jgi:hypothetical protein